jgi:HEAT repeats
MPITAECPVCGHKGPVPDTFKGKKVKCHECHNMFTVGGGAAAAAGARPAAKKKSNPDMGGSGMNLAGANGVGPGDATPNPFEFENPAPPPPQPTRKSAPGTAKKPAVQASPTSKSAQGRPRPLKKNRNLEPLPIGALVLGGLAAIMGLGAIIIAKKDLIGLGSVPVAGFGLLLAIGGVVTSMGKGWPILVPVLGLLVCLGALPVGGYHTYQLIASGRLSSADEQAKKTTTAAESKPEGAITPEIRTPPTQPNLPPPPPLSNPDEWMDAKQGFRLGNIVVKVVGLESDVLRGKDGREVSKDKHALLRIDIMNVGKGDVDYFSWATRPPQGGDPLPQLTDSNGAEVKWAQPEATILVNQISGAETIQPGRTVSDILVYAIPPDSTNYLRLELVGSNVGEKGKFRLQVPKGMLAAFVKGMTPDNPGDAPPKQGDPRTAKFVQEQVALLQKAKTEAEKTTALNFIGGCGKDAAPAAGELARFLKGQPAGVRAAAAEALSRIGPGARGQVSALQGALKDEFWKVKANAAKALGNIGPDAKVAIPDLLPLIDSKDDEVPQNAKEAIRKLDPSKLPKK